MVDDYSRHVTSSIDEIKLYIHTVYYILLTRGIRRAPMNNTKRRDTIMGVRELISERRLFQKSQPDAQISAGLCALLLFYFFFFFFRHLTFVYPSIQRQTMSRYYYQFEQQTLTIGYWYSFVLDLVLVTPVIWSSTL